MKSGLVHFAIVGCGTIAAKHIAALSELGEEARLVAVCDLNIDRAKAKAEPLGVPYYSDASAMLAAHPEIEVINVLVPTGHHASAVMQLAPHGRHIVIEKPMALRVDDCERMLAACEAAGSKLFVVYQNRYNPLIAAARRAVEAGKLGKLVLATVRVRWKRDQKYYDADSWRGTWAFDGGVLAQQGSHHLDLLLWFGGDVTTTSCLMATRLLDIEVEDTATSIMRFESGALGVYEATVAARPDNLEGSLSLLGEMGSIVIGGVNLNKVLEWRFTGEPDAAPPQGDAARQPHASYLADVVTAVRTGVAPPWLVGGREGLRNVQALAASYESAARNGAAIAPATCEATHPLGVM